MLSERGSAERFMRRFTLTDDSYSLALFTDDQLQYLADHPDAAIHVDTTFNISKKPTNMYALITTIRACEFKGDPLLLGPILLTTRRRERDYAVLWQEIIGREPRLCKLNTFVTNGEEAMIKSIQGCFTDLYLVRCMIHLNDNCRSKAREFLLPPRIIDTVMKSISDLVMAKRVEFDALAEEAIKQWTVSALAEKVGDKMGKFIKYFRRQVLPVLLPNLQDSLELAGVNVVQRNNNPAESMNAKVKRNITSGEKVDKICQELKIMALAQTEEMRKASRNLSHVFVKKVEVSSVDREDLMPEVDADAEPVHSQASERLVRNQCNVGSCKLNSIRYNSVHCSMDIVEQDLPQKLSIFGVFRRQLFSN